MNLKWTLQKSPKNKLSSLLLIVSDESVRKGIALRAMDYFEEIRMTDNLAEVMEVIAHQKFSVIIIDGDYLPQIKSLKKFFESVAYSVIMFLGTQIPSDLEEYEKIEKCKMYEKPIFIKHIISDIIDIINARS